MTFEDISFPGPETNLQYDDDLLGRAEKGGGGEVLRFWESPVLFVVLGRTGKQEDDVYGEVCQKDAVPVLRRTSGGGTVLQGPGCLNFSLVLSKERHHELMAIQSSYVFILEKIALALKRLGVDARFRPICDLVTASDDRKFSGNAQRRGRNFILHHGTILYDFQLSLISRYLKIPLKMPDYRSSRPHEQFVSNIGKPVQDIKHAIRDIFLKEY